MVLTELIQPNLDRSLNNKKRQGELEDGLEDTLAMVKVTKSLNSVCCCLNYFCLSFLA